jgi:hypothetical protein
MFVFSSVFCCAASTLKSKARVCVCVNISKNVEPEKKNNGTKVFISTASYSGSLGFKSQAGHRIS